jgi:VanZ family protein
MFERLTACAAWALLAFIVYATISPIQLRPTISRSADLEHLLAFAVLGGSFCLAYPRRLVLVCFVVLCSAITLEFLQLLTPDRHARLLDATEKLAGGAAGVLITRAALSFEPLRRRFQN